MESLPTEVISNIASYLGKDQIRACMKVCRSLYTRMSPNYYQSVDCTMSGQRFLQLTEITRIDGKKIGDFARSIKFFYISDLEETDFRRLIKNLPLLQTIEFDTLDDCIQHMISIPLENLQHIKEITAYTIDKDIKDMILALNIKLKDRITNLLLNDVDVALNYTNTGYDNIFTAVSTFTRLTSLFVYVDRVQTTSYLENILSSCSHLTSLHFKSQRRLQLSEGFNTIHTNLQSINLEQLNGIPFENLDYIMSCLPNLKHLTLDHFRPPNASQFDLTVERSQRFVDYLKTLTSFDFREWNSQDQFCIQDEDFWLYIRGLVGNGYSCNLDIQVCDHESFRGILVSGDMHKKIISIKNSWISNNDMYNVPWIQSINFLNVKSISILDIKAGPNIDDQFTRLVEPAVNMLKSNRSTSFCLTRYFQGIPLKLTLKFIDTESFHYMQQKHSNDERQTRRDEVLNLVDKLRPILGDQILEVTKSPSPYEVEYLVEVDNAPR